MTSKDSGTRMVVFRFLNKYQARTDLPHAHGPVNRLLHPVREHDDDARIEQI